MTVYTDEKWLSFMIEQLLSNALKYTSNGGISIYAEGKALVIEDTGIGISPEDLPRLAQLGMTKGRADNNPVPIDPATILSILEQIYDPTDTYSTEQKGA